MDLPPASLAWLSQHTDYHVPPEKSFLNSAAASLYEGWNFNSGNYLFTTDTK